MSIEQTLQNEKSLKDTEQAKAEHDYLTQHKESILSYGMPRVAYDLLLESSYKRMVGK